MHTCYFLQSKRQKVITNKTSWRMYACRSKADTNGYTLLLTDIVHSTKNLLYPQVFLWLPFLRTIPFSRMRPSQLIFTFLLCVCIYLYTLIGRWQIRVNASEKFQVAMRWNP